MTWNNLYLHLTKSMKTNNGTIINPVKSLLTMEQNLFLFFPTTQFIFNNKFSPPVFKHLKYEPCKCPFQKLFSEEELLIDQKGFK